MVIIECADYIGKIDVNPDTSQQTQSGIMEMMGSASRNIKRIEAKRFVLDPIAPVLTPSFFTPVRREGVLGISSAFGGRILDTSHESWVRLFLLDLMSHTPDFATTNLLRDPEVLARMTEAFGTEPSPQNKNYNRSAPRPPDMVRLTEQAKKLIDEKDFASVATLMPNGSPQVAPLWVDREGDIVVINTTEKRQRYRNLKKDPRVALCVFDRANPYSKVLIRGRVIEITTKGAEEHIDKLSMKYHGRKYPDHRSDEPRVIIRIKPEHVTH